MKANRKQKPETFEPVTIEITFESEDEMQAFYNMFNYSGICAFCQKHGINPSAIRYAMPDSNADNSWTEFLIEFKKTLGIRQ